MNVAQRVVRGLEEAKKKLFPPEVSREAWGGTVNRQKEA